MLSSAMKAARDVSGLLAERLIRQPGGPERPPSITQPGGGGKFALNGHPLRFPGNTFLCHIDPKSDFYSALCEMQERLKQSPVSRHYAFLPKPSFHMTVFCGVSGDPLGIDGWPKVLPQETSLPEISSGYLSKFSRLKGPGKLTVRPSGLNSPSSIAVAPDSDEDTIALRKLRHQLQDLTGLYRDDIDDYQFHVTLAYLLEWLDEIKAADLSAYSLEAFDECFGKIEPITLGPVEFCEFETMEYFSPLERLR